MFRVDFERISLRGNYFNPFLNPTCDPNPFVYGGGFEWDDFESDHFRMYSFKIKKCPLNRAHDWLICPYAHQGERARRRDPLAIPYVALPCPNYKGRRGICPRGDLCGYAHGVFEYWLHPAKYRTRYCNARGFCTRPVCFFAHSPQELRVASVPHHVREWIQDTLLAELQARANGLTRIHGGGGGPSGGVGVGPCPNLMVQDHNAGRSTTTTSDIVPNTNNNMGLNFEVVEMVPDHTSRSTTTSGSMANANNNMGLNLEILESLRALSINDYYFNNHLSSNVSNDNVGLQKPNLDWISDLLAG